MYKTLCVSIFVPYCLYVPRLTGFNKKIDSVNQ
jgi:hypothetical protein